MVFDLIVFKAPNYTFSRKETLVCKSFAAAKRAVNKFVKSNKYLDGLNLTNWTPPTKILSAKGNMAYRCSMRRDKDYKRIVLVLNWTESVHYGL